MHNKENQISLFDLMKKPKNVTVNKLPEGIKLNRDELFCPYCTQVSKFQKNRFGIKACAFCGISINDYWIKKVNKIIR